MVAVEGNWLNGTGMVIVVDVGKEVMLHLRLYIMIMMTYIPADLQGRWPSGLIIDRGDVKPGCNAG